jgi:hypothetical protein
LAPLVVAAVAVSACGVPHPPISNGTVSGCYRALPAAQSAVHDRRAKLLGVHRVPADRVRAGALSAGVSLPPDQDTIVCAVAFQGTFRPGQVTAAQAGATGRYAVVLVTSSHLRVLASFVGDQLPRSFRGHLVL